MKQPANPTANPMIVLREEFDDWAILFDPDTGDAHGINPVGVFIWKRLDGHHSLEDIIGDLQETCDGMPEEAQTYVETFIKELMDRGYVGIETQF